mmetsp:Transcript_19949/g.29675  ORF Transcript_19949/g.29675 Transcript_19949/m.29675 type:complete len:348 (-) Transcript_19949:72-1115(-)
MEKYNKFTDHHTGKHPFLPIQRRRTRCLSPQYVVTLILSTLLVIVRLPFVLLFGGLFYIAPLRILERFFARLLLFVLGFYSIETLHAPHSTTTDKHQLILLNHCSYIDVIAACVMFAPDTYVFGPNQYPHESSTPINSANAVIQDDHEKIRQANLVGKLTLYPRTTAALGSVLHSEDRIPSTSIKQMLTTTTRRRRFVVFPEGAATNGRVLLFCFPMFEQMDAATADLFQLQIASISYRQRACYFLGLNRHWCLHLLRLAMNWSNHMSIKFAQHVPSFQQASSPQAWQEQIYDSMAKNANVQRAKIGAPIKQDFLTYYHQRSSTKQSGEKKSRKGKGGGGKGIRKRR